VGVSSGHGTKRGAWSTVGYCNPNPQIDRNWLVVWNMNFMTFHSVGIIPTEELIFFRGVGIPPTSTGNNRNIISHDSIINIHDNQYSNNNDHWIPLLE
jgi:hypothetical protein